MVAKWSGVLSTTEPRNDIGVLNVRQGNINSETAEFMIIQNNKPYNLTGLKVDFCANFGLSAVQKSAVVKDAVNGKIEFTFNDPTMQAVGRNLGYFQISKDGSLIDSTQDFEYRIQDSILSRKMQGGSYIESFENILETLGDNAAVGLANDINRLEDKTTAQFQQTSAQLAQTEAEIETVKSVKMDKNTSDISVTQINKNRGKFDQTYMSDEFLQQIAGTTPVNAIPADKSIATTKLADSAVTYLKTNFLKTGKNLFDKDTLTAGYYVNSTTTGALTANASYSASDWIRVSPSTDYVRLYSRHIAFYTIDKNFISGLPNGTSFTTPENCFYIRVSTVPIEQDNEKIEQGELSAEYERYGYRFEKLFVEKENVRFDILDAQSSINLFNKDAVEEGKYVTATIGQILSNDLYSVSEYIRIEPETYYSIAHPEQTAFYDEQKSFISGLTAYNLSPIQSPSGARFMRISTRLTNLATQQVVKGVLLGAYEKFGLKVDVDSIPNQYGSDLKEKTKKEISSNNHRIVGDSLKNPFVKTNIRLLGDSITFGTNSTDGGWATSLINVVNSKFNKEHIVPLTDKNISYYGNILEYEGSSINTITGSYMRMKNYIGKVFEFSFYGDHLSVYYIKDSNGGIFEVYVDGVKASTVDTYGESISYRNEEVVTGLVKDYHEVEVRLTNQKNTLSSDGNIRIEGVKIPKTANVINSGVSGQTSAGTQSSAVTSDDDVVFIQVGTNDRHSFESPNTTKANIIRAYNSIKAKGDIDVVLMCANPVSIANDTDPIRNFRMEDVEMAVSDVALQLNTPYIDNYHAFLDYSDNTGVSLEDLVSDGLHPGDAGYKVMYDNIAKNIGLAKIRDGISL